MKRWWNRHNDLALQENRETALALERQFKENDRVRNLRKKFGLPEGSEYETSIPFSQMKLAIARQEEKIQSSWANAIHIWQQYKVGGYRITDKQLREAHDQYRKAVQLYNDMIDYGAANFHGEQTLGGRIKAKDLESEGITMPVGPNSRRIRSRLSSLKRAYSPVKGRGISSTFIRLRDTQTGRFVSRN